MAPRAVRRVVWVPFRATFSTSMAQAVAGGRRPFAGWRDAATRMRIVPGGTGGMGGGALSRLRRRPPFVRVAMPVFLLADTRTTTFGFTSSLAM
eukprot:scaffold64687_cov74-Phaeocystis_antarctica.AAC.1